jgi:serine protease Do
VARTNVGKSAKLTVLRDGNRVPIEVEIGELRDREIVASGPREGKLGLTVQEITPQIAESLGLDRARGVIITAVQPHSPATEAGFRRGDAILQVDRREIAGVKEFQQVVDAAKPGANMLFLIRRGNNNLFLALKSPGQQG